MIIDGELVGDPVFRFFNFFYKTAERGVFVIQRKLFDRRLDLLLDVPLELPVGRFQLGNHPSQSASLVVERKLAEDTALLGIEYVFDRLFDGPADALGILRVEAAHQRAAFADAAGKRSRKFGALPVPDLLT